jgi:hypothetical protein
VLFENRTCFLLDFFDSHTFMLHSPCVENNVDRRRMTKRNTLYLNPP